MNNQRSSDAESTLSKRDIHEEWRDNYRTPDNEHFYRMAFAHIVDKFDAEHGAQIWMPAAAVVPSRDTLSTRDTGSWNRPLG